MFHDHSVCGALVRPVLREHFHVEPFDREVLQRTVRLAEDHRRTPCGALCTIDRDVLDSAQARFRCTLLQYELEYFGATPPVPVSPVDRKSTRLNSSHANI